MNEVQIKRYKLYALDDGAYLAEVGFHPNLIKASHVVFDGVRFKMLRQPVWDEFVGTTMNLLLEKEEKSI